MHQRCTKLSNLHRTDLCPVALTRHSQDAAGGWGAALRAVGIAAAPDGRAHDADRPPRRAERLRLHALEAPWTTIDTAYEGWAACKATTPRTLRADG